MASNSKAKLQIMLGHARAVGLQGLVSLVQLIGVEEANQEIETAYRKAVEVKSQDAVFVRRIISEKLACPEADILYSNKRDQHRYYAIGFCVYYLFHVLENDMPRIMLMLNKGKSVCYKSLTTIRTLNPHHHSDEKYLKVKAYADPLVYDYKTRKVKQNIVNYDKPGGRRRRKQ